MRKGLILLLFISTSVLAYPDINSKYEQGPYVFESSRVNTKGKEIALSDYKDGKIVYLRDGVVFQSTLDSLGELLPPEKSEDFSLLNITGTVAYDSLRNKLYYSIYDPKEGGDYLYESDFSSGKWSLGKKMKIRGTNRSKTQVGFMESAGWNYRSRPIKGFYNPRLSKEGKRLYFTYLADGGQRDIYYVDIESEATDIWSYPQNVGFTVNTSSDEDWSYISGDSVLYYSSTSTDGLKNIYVSQKDGEGWGMGKKLSLPYNDSVKTNNYNIMVRDGLPLLISDRNTENGDDIFLFHPIIPKEPVVDQVEIERRKKFYWVFFLFDFDKDILAETFKRDLNNLTKAMREFKDVSFEISGYTDSRGSDEYNDALSLRRANEIKDLLVKEGFKPEQLVTVGYGERRLQVPNAKTEEEHAQNRRVEVRIIVTE